MYFRAFLLFLSAQIKKRLKLKKNAKNETKAKKEESGAIIIPEITSHLLFLITATKYLH